MLSVRRAILAQGCLGIGAARQFRPRLTSDGSGLVCRPTRLCGFSWDPPARSATREASQWRWRRGQEIPNAGTARGITASAPFRADAEVDEMAIQWSGTFDGKLKMLMMEAEMLERELCENPSPERQAVIGKTMARSARARTLGQELFHLYDELDGLIGVVNDFNEDAGTREAFRTEAQHVELRMQRLQAELIVELLPRDLDDELGVVLEVRAAAGGSEASLFAAEVFGMYQKFCARKGWVFNVMSISPAEEKGGVKEVCASISGENVYGTLKFESGVHRVQRVPVTEGAGRVHTSTVSVAVMPDGASDEFKVHERDIKIEVMRASGAGGQSVNTTESAVRMTHLPTGVTVKCADERSQHKNRAKALTILTARLYDKHKLEQQQAESAQRQALVGTGDRSERIRTFNYAQDRVTDHRVNASVFGVESFLAGEELVEDLIDRLRRADAAVRLKEMD